MKFAMPLAEAKNCIQVFSGQLGCEVVELNIRQDHIHLISNVAPKVSISKFMGTLKGRTAIRVFSKLPYLRDKPYWGNHFWAPGYCVDTVGLDAEMIRKYVKYQETKERREEQSDTINPQSKIAPIRRISPSPVKTG